MNRIKKCFLPSCLWLIISLLAGPGHAAQAPIGKSLQTALAVTQGAEPIPVIIRLHKTIRPSDFKGLPPVQGRRALVRGLHSEFGRSQAPLKQILQQAGIHVSKDLWHINALATSVSPALLETIRRLPEVASVELDSVIPAPGVSPAFTGAVEWNLDSVGAPALWDLGFDGTGIVIASIDSGVDVNHPDLSSRWRGGPADWFDPVDFTTSPADYPVTTENGGHGTSTTAVMVGGNAGGTYIGIAPGAQWIAARIFPAEGGASSSDIHLAFAWALDPDGDGDPADAPHILNNSWGFDDSPDFCLETFKSDIDALEALGIAVVFSAGNTGTGAPATSVSPGNNRNALAVGAVNRFEQLASFSAEGPSPCDPAGEVYPELVAPGVNIKTAWPTSSGSSYVFVSGTSFASPQVAGVMALLMQAFPQKGIAELEAAMLQNAVDLGPPGPDQEFGHGRVDALAAYQFLDSVIADISIVDPVAPVDDQLVDFGSVPPFDQRSLVLTVANLGSTDLRVLSLDQSRIGAGFSVTGDLCSGQAIPAAGNCQVTITYAPTGLGATTGSLSILSDDPLTARVEVLLRGTGNHPPPAAVLQGPENGSVNIQLPVTLQWTRGIDADGDRVEDQLYISESTDFSQVTPVNIAAVWPKTITAGAGIMALGCLLRRRGWQHLSQLLTAGTFLALLVSCGGGGGSASPASAGGSQQFQASGLQSGTTYFWKVVSTDSRGGSTESPVWQFTTL